VSGGLITAPELAARLDEPGLAILDTTVLLTTPQRDGEWSATSGRERFAEAHIPRSVHADLLGDLADPDGGFHFAQLAPRELATRLARLGVGQGSSVVVYDDDQRMWSTRLWLSLRAIGVDAVQVLDGGLAAWKAAGLPLDQGPAAPTGAVPLVPHARFGVLVDRATVLDIVEGRCEAQLFCTLKPDAFSGVAPTRYARRGRIAGSANAPSTNVLASDGRFLSSSKLRTVLKPILEDPRPIVLYCGGGISASLLAFALFLVGRTDVSVYDGSLEDWSSDPSLPMEIG
jgi:thiosulfate/3-mercaptopyruvate sulfurtransferase